MAEGHGQCTAAHGLPTSVDGDSTTGRRTLPVRLHFYVICLSSELSGLHLGVELISVIPKTDILLTHGPPLQVHDLTTRDVHAGCPALLERVSQIQPRLHVFGHIHEGRGATLRKWDDEAVAVADGMPLGGESDTLSRMTTFVNAANMPMPKGPRNWEKRQLPGSPGWQPIIVDLLDAV